MHTSSSETMSKILFSNSLSRWDCLALSSRADFDVDDFDNDNGLLAFVHFESTFFWNVYKLSLFLYIVPHKNIDSVIFSVS